MKKPKISLVMPAFNSENTISRAIESTLSQTFKDFELIIIDDNSSDSTYSISRKYAAMDKRIRLYKNKENLQIARTLNKSVLLSNADLIARMDSDDASYPERLEHQYNYLKKHPKTAIVGANIKIVDGFGNYLYKRVYPTSSKKLKKVMFRYSPFAHPVVMFRKSVFTEFGGYDSGKVPCEDIDLWFKIASKYDIGNINKYLLEYTLLPQSQSNSNSNLRRLELLGFKIKLNAIERYGFKPNLGDIVFNLGQFITMWFMPSKLRVSVYNLLRSNKVI